MLKIKKEKELFTTKCTTISGYCGSNFEDNLKRFEKELKKKGGYINGIVPIRAVVIYSEKVEKVKE